MRELKLLGLVVVVCSLAGCGGAGSSQPGSSGNTSNTGGGSTESTQLGQLSLKFTGSAKPQITTYSNITVATMAGVSFTSVSMIPNKTVANSVIAFTAGNDDLWCYQNGTATNITSSSGYGVLSAGCTADGRIGFLANDPVHGGNGLFACNYDGSNVTLLFDYPQFQLDCVPTFSPNGKRVGFVGLDGNLVTANLDGSGMVTVDTADNVSWPAWSPDSSTIVYAKNVDGNDDMFTASQGGGNIQQISNQTYYSGSTRFPCYSPNGQYICCTLTPTNGSDQNVILQVNSIVPFLLPVPAGNNDFYPVFSPDGKTLAFVRNGSGFSGYISTENVSGQGASTLVGTQYNVRSLSWSPYFGQRLFIGSGGVNASTAAGLIWTQLSDGFASMATFTASSPSTATITETGQYGDYGDLVFDLHASALAGLQWTNGYYNPATKIAISGTDALVTVSSTSGQIETVAPFAVGKATAKIVNSELVYTGRFSAFYTHDGKNHAPNGATKVVFDHKARTVQSLTSL